MGAMGGNGQFGLLVTRWVVVSLSGATDRGRTGTGQIHNLGLCH